MPGSTTWGRCLIGLMRQILELKLFSIANPLKSWPKVWRKSRLCIVPNESFCLKSQVKDDSSPIPLFENHSQNFPPLNDFKQGDYHKENQEDFAKIQLGINFLSEDADSGLSGFL